MYKSLNYTKVIYRGDIMYVHIYINGKLVDTVAYNVYTGLRSDGIYHNVPTNVCNGCGDETPCKCGE
jgi:hypothetical protein